jgi:hypothetical protein
MSNNLFPFCASALRARAVASLVTISPNRKEEKEQRTCNQFQVATNKFQIVGKSRPSVRLSTPNVADRF